MATFFFKQNLYTEEVKKKFFHFVIIDFSTTKEGIVVFGMRFCVFVYFT